MIFGLLSHYAFVSYELDKASYHFFSSFFNCGIAFLGIGTLNSNARKEGKEEREKGKEDMVWNHGGGDGRADPLSVVPHTAARLCAPFCISLLWCSNQQ
jgi:hypothetical protein